MPPRRRENGRIVFVARFRQYFEKPIRYGKARRTIAANLLAGDVLQQATAMDHVCMELLVRQFVGQLVGVSVRRDFMSSFGRVFDQLRESLRNPAEKET